MVLGRRIGKQGYQFKWPVWLVSATCLFVLFLLVGYPTLRVLSSSLHVGDGWGLANYTKLFFSDSFRGLFFESVGVSVLSACTATLMGTLLAIIVVKTDAPFRRLFTVSAILPIVLPGFITAIAYIYLFGRNGLITYKLLGITWNVYSWKSVCILQVLDQTTTAFLLVAASLSTIGGRLEEAARTLGASELRILCTVTLRLAAPMIMAACLLNFMRAMGDFGTPLVVGGPFDTLASASYTQLIGKYDLSMAATYNVVLLCVCMVVYSLYTRLERSSSDSELSWRSGSGGKLEFPGFAGKVAWGIAALFSLLVWGLVVAVFMAAFTRQMGYDAHLTLSYFQAIAERGFGSTINTVLFALAVAVTVSIGGQMLAYLIQRIRVPASTILDTLATMPFALPGTFIGVGYAIAFSSPPLVLTGTWFLVAMNLIVRKMPLGLRAGSALLAKLDSSLDEASTLLGSGRVRTFIKVTLPNMRPAMLACGLYAFVTTVQALGSIIFIITPGTKLLSVDVFEAVVRGDLGIAAAYSVLMLGIGVVGGGILLVFLQRSKPMTGSPVKEQTI